jgi:hypothetical protein
MARVYQQHPDPSASSVWCYSFQKGDGDFSCILNWEQW